MEYKEILNLLGGSNNQTKNWIEINDLAYEAYDTYSQITFKCKSNLGQRVYSALRILAKRITTVRSAAVSDVYANNTNEKVIFENCAPFTHWVSKMKDIKTDNAKDLNAMMLTYDLLKCSKNYPKTSES